MKFVRLRRGLLLAEDEDEDEADDDFSGLRLKSRVSVLDGMLSSPLTVKKERMIKRMKTYKST